MKISSPAVTRSLALAMGTKAIPALGTQPAPRGSKLHADG
jgi:hypothetical protein